MLVISNVSIRTNILEFDRIGNLDGKYFRIDTNSPNKPCPKNVNQIMECRHCSTIIYLVILLLTQFSLHILCLTINLNIKKKYLLFYLIAFLFVLKDNS